MNHRVQEAMKSLRTNIQFCGSDKKVIMLTSCISGEGKSETSLRLAMSLAELNRRVILVDTDLRKSVLLSKISYSHDSDNARSDSFPHGTGVAPRRRMHDERTELPYDTRGSVPAESRGAVEQPSL